MQVCVCVWVGRGRRGWIYEWEKALSNKMKIWENFKKIGCIGLALTCSLWVVIPLKYSRICWHSMNARPILVYTYTSLEKERERERTKPEGRCTQRTFSESWWMRTMWHLHREFKYYCICPWPIWNKNK